MKILMIVLDIILLIAGLVNIGIGASFLFAGDLFGLFNLVIGLVVILLAVTGLRRDWSD